jgi:hypothetical protein
MLKLAVLMARKKRPASTERRLHRAFGAGAAVFVIFMVLSGLIINHSNGLGLDQRHVSQPLLLSWYGLGEPENIDSFAVGSDWLSFAGSQLYLNDRLVSSISNGLGAVFAGDLLVAAGGDELLLLDNNGKLIERMPWQHSGIGPIESIGIASSGNVVVNSGGQYWLADAQFLSWKSAGDTIANPEWSFAEPAPESLLKAITQQYRGEGPSLERLLLDIHSGRIFGPIGMVVYDLLALILAFLAISGLILWVRGRRNGKRKPSRPPPL